MTSADQVTAASRLAGKLADISFANLEPNTVEIARQRVCDTLGALILGEDVLASQSLHELSDDLAGGGYSSLLDDVRRLSAAVRASEVDDIATDTCTTAGAVAVPVALVLGNARRADDRTMLSAVVAGYDVMSRVGAAIDGAHRVYEGVWPSLVGAPMAAAATACGILGLDAEATVNALAIAAQRGTNTPGRVVGDMTSRWLVFGCAAADGALAAMAAERGMVGDPAMIESALARTGPTLDLDALTADHGSWWIHEVDVKPFCTARQVQAAVEAAMEAGSLFQSNEVESITVHVPRQYMLMLDRPQPRDRLASIASAQYQVAVALAQPESLYDVARTNVTVDRRIRSLMECIRVCEGTDLTALYPRQWGGRVSIRSADGQQRQREVHEPAGAAAHSFGWKELLEKHHRLGNGNSRVIRLVEACQDIARHSSLDGLSVLADLVLSRGRQVAQCQTGREDKDPLLG